MFLHSTKRQRQAVDEADEVRPAAVEVAAYPQLTHAEETVVLRPLEVQDAEPFPHPLAPVVAEGDGHAVAYQRVLLPVGGDDGLRGEGGGELPDRLVAGGLGQSRIERRQPLAQRAHQHHVPVRGAAEQAVRPEVLVVVRVDGFPAEPFLQVVGGGLLDEGVFGVEGGGHRFIRARSCFVSAIPASICRPAAVRRYFCMRLRGLSGMVSSSRFMARCFSMARLKLPVRVE